MKRETLKRISTAALAVLLLVFVGYQIFRQNYTGIRTERTLYGVAWDSMEVSAVVIRNESYVTADAEGVVSYQVKNGEHVGKNSVVASVYSSEEDARKASEMRSVEEQIEQLQHLNSYAVDSSTSPEIYDESISESLFQLCLSAEQKNVSDISEWSQNFLYTMSQKQIASGKIENYDGKIAELSEEYSSLQASISGSYYQITAPSAGYFIGEADGYEFLYSYDDVLNLTVEDLAAEPQEQSVPENVVGKICSDYKWYVAFAVDRSRAVDFKNIMDSYQDEVYLTLPFASAEEIPAQVVAVNQESFQSDGVVILECTYMDENVASLRFEEMEVELCSYSGLMVSQSNVHFEDVEEVLVDDDGNETVVVHENVQGVYVLNGSVIEFVQIFPKATINGYVICKTTPDEEDTVYTSSTLSLYDEVITERKNVFDGKFIY